MTERLETRPAAMQIGSSVGCGSAPCLPHSTAHNVPSHLSACLPGLGCLLRSVYHKHLLEEGRKEGREKGEKSFENSFPVAQFWLGEKVEDAALCL